MKDTFYDCDKELVLKKLSTDADTGLSSKEVSKRKDIYGENTLPRGKQDSILKIFFSGLKDPIVILLFVTIIFSIIIGEIIDAVVIFFIVLLDLVLGTIEEYSANKNADSLRNLIKYKVKVIRDSENMLIDSEYLVPGDIVLLESGDNIASDMRIIECSNLQVDESILTGESINVFKTNKVLKKNTPLQDRINMLYAGGTITSGRCIAVVTSIGINTEIGKIASTVNNIKEEKSPLSIRINKLSKQISLLLIFIALIIFIILSLKGMPTSEIFMAVIALSVSAMPEGLPLALTMALTITSNMMVKKKVIVKKLEYVESLGSCTVIATDKTGTLTVNEQTAKIICLPNQKQYEVEGVGYEVKGGILKLDLENKALVDNLILQGRINNESKKDKRNHYIGDSIDIAFNILSEKNNIYSDEYEVIKRIPYESENKYSAIFYKYKNDIYCSVKGSFEVIASFCDKMAYNNTDKKIDIDNLSKKNDELSQNGYRVIALAFGKVKKFVDKEYYTSRDIPSLTFLGMVGFIDPVREDILSAINTSKEAGIKVLMITGDHPLTAYKIASDLSICKSYDEVVIGSDLSKYKDDTEFDNFISNKKVFARTTPEDKFRIVESLKRRGEFVAVTGDGVNDALAIRSANIGISMGSGTDTARETASMIITDDSFKSIVSGIELGRCAYSNIRKVCFFLLSCGLAEVLFFLLSIIFNLPMPLVAIELLWLNLVTDGFQDIALSFEKSESGIMKRKPISPKENIFNRELLSEVIYSGFIIGIIVFIVWYILINKLNMEITLARGYIMALMVFIQNVHVFNCRSERLSAFKISLKSNPLIIFTVFGSIFLHIIVMESSYLSEFLKVKPIPYNHMFFLVAFSLIILIAMEIYKMLKKE